MKKSALAAAIHRPAGKPVKTFSTASKEDDANYVGLGAEGLLAITDKLLATNRGIIPTDDRDSLEFKTILTPDRLAAERIQLDAGKIRLKTLRQVARRKSLQGINPGHFTPYIRGLYEGNSLSMPLEEINPLHVLEQARRVTAMGPGGLGSEDAITEDSQAVHASQFGYFSPNEGPESSRAGIDKRLAYGVRFGSDGQLYQVMRNRKTGQNEWLSHVKAAQSVIKIPD